MQFDFSALDSELESLGRPAEDALALARKFASGSAASAPGAGLDEIDRTLAALESDGGSNVALAIGPWTGAQPAEALDTSPAVPSHEVWASVPSEPEAPASAPSAPPPEAAAALYEAPAPAYSEPPAPAYSEPPPARASGAPPATPLTQSQEIVLPDPIARDELSTESGELRLDGHEPSSGSFELPETPISARTPEGSLRPEPRGSAREQNIEAQDLARAGAEADARPLTPFDDVQDALEGSQPLLLDSAHRELSAFGDRDPDAEFDALLSEATDPRGMPTRAGASGEVDTDDLLRGLEGDELTDDVLSVDELAAADADEPNEVELLTRSLFEDTGDSTEVIDRSVFGTLQSEPKTDPDPTLADELDSGELEIVMEDDNGATLAPPPGPQSSKAPPPPPPPGDKRPSLLGRLFNKRDPE
jgi:hypothetical protein